MQKINQAFGSKVFCDTTMKESLSNATYKKFLKVLDGSAELDITTANEIANAMKNWAVSLGATHYTHWFQPMTGNTAEKHDSFISRQPGGQHHGDKVIMEFSGKELIKGESDASSLPSGGLRTTFEARGYTAWDLTSYAFVKGNSLYIPTAFCSYSGEALDKKTPLLRSIDAVSKQALRVLKFFNSCKDAEKVISESGIEQEYFLVDRDLYQKRPDLIFTGRTLFGALPPKLQELDDHYFGTLKTRVEAYMNELDNALWELGIPSKTKHNEVAPSQHECAALYETANLAADHNQLMMELMKKIARKHNFACLLHEKPFKGINGSGKHDNWSLSTDTGINLLDPGNSPIENAQFLTFLAAVIAAVDNYPELLRLSVASSGNDLRLGVGEAPPPVISIFLGDELSDVIEALCSNREAKDLKEEFDFEVSTLPKFQKDTTDRNRTSPFAFTGNKFEFRMVGSSFSITGPNIIINTIVADSLSDIADELEAAQSKGANFKSTLKNLLIKLFEKHKKIIFNGNGYDSDWIEEAAARGLPILKGTADAIPTFGLEKNIALFQKHGVFTDIEINSRTEIFLENYIKEVKIEARTAIDMSKKLFLPAGYKFQKQLFDLLIAKNQVNEIFKNSLANLSMEYDTENENFDFKLIKEVNSLIKNIFKFTEELEKIIDKTDNMNFKATEEHALKCQNEVLPILDKLRDEVDALENLTPAEIWPVPTYSELLFSAK